MVQRQFVWYVIYMDDKLEDFMEARTQKFVNGDRRLSSNEEIYLNFESIGNVTQRVRGVPWTYAMDRGW